MATDEWIIKRVAKEWPLTYSRALERLGLNKATATEVARIASKVEAALGEQGNVTLDRGWCDAPVVQWDFEGVVVVIRADVEVQDA